MTAPTLEDIKRAAAGKGAEPLYTQAFWRAAVLVLLALLKEQP